MPRNDWESVIPLVGLNVAEFYVFETSSFFTDCGSIDFSGLWTGNGENWVEKFGEEMVGGEVLGGRGFLDSLLVFGEYYPFFLGVFIM